MVNDLTPNSQVKPKTGGGLASKHGVIEKDKRSGRFVGTEELTEKQRAFVDSMLANGGREHEAAISAGYANPREECWRLRRNPAIQNELRTRMQERVLGGQVTAWNVMQELMTDPTVAAPTRFAASKWTLEAAGHGLEAAKLRAKVGLEGQKSMSEMTTEELEAHVAMLSAAVAGKKVIESTIEAESEDITPQ